MKKCDENHHIPEDTTYPLRDVKNTRRGSVHERDRTIPKTSDRAVPRRPPPHQEEGLKRVDLGDNYSTSNELA